MPEMNPFMDAGAALHTAGSKLDKILNDQGTANIYFYKKFNELEARIVELEKQLAGEPQ